MKPIFIAPLRSLALCEIVGSILSCLKKGFVIFLNVFYFINWISGKPNEVLSNKIDFLAALINDVGFTFVFCGFITSESLLDSHDDDDIDDVSSLDIDVISES